MDFILKTSYQGWTPLKYLTKASATVIEKGDMVALSSGLAIKAVAGSTAIAYAMADAIDWDTVVAVLDDKNAEFIGTGDAVFAVTYKWAEVDLVGTTNQLIDLGSTSTDVFKVSADQNAGTVDSSDSITVRINKPIY